jgi:hypothetical protein
MSTFPGTFRNRKFRPFAMCPAATGAGEWPKYTNGARCRGPDRQDAAAARDGEVIIAEKCGCSRPRTSSENTVGTLELGVFPMILPSKDAVAIFGCEGTH